MRSPVEPIAQTRQTVVRYDIADGCELLLPFGAKPLACLWHEGGPKLWVMADPELPKVRRRVAMISTGHALDGEWEHVPGLVQDGAHLWLVFVENC